MLQTFRGALTPASATALAASTAPAAPWAAVNVPAATPVAALAWTAGLVSPDSPAPQRVMTRAAAGPFRPRHAAKAMANLMEDLLDWWDG